MITGDRGNALGGRRGETRDQWRQKKRGVTLGRWWDKAQNCTPVVSRYSIKNPAATGALTSASVMTSAPFNSLPPNCQVYWVSVPPQCSFHTGSMHASSGLCWPRPSEPSAFCSLMSESSRRTRGVVKGYILTAFVLFNSVIYAW